MQEKTLLTTALICSVIGIFIILSISENLEPKKYDIINITKENLDEQVRIIGILTNLKETEELIIMNVKDNTGEIKVIAFKNKQFNFTENQILDIEGKVVVYKGIIEIEAIRIIGR